MAGRRRKKKTRRIFWLTLVLTVSLGTAVMFGAWAFMETDGAHSAFLDIEETQPVQNSFAESGSNTDGSVPQLGADDLQRDEKETDFKEEQVQPLLENENSEKTEGAENAAEKEVSVVFAGDILFDHNYAVMASTLQRGNGIEGSVSRDLLDVMRDADICMINNEFPYTDRGEPTPDKIFTFRAKPQYASWLLDMGVDIVSLANNHVYDYGEISLLDTLDTLNEIGMPYAGAGRNLEEAMRPVHFEVDGIDIAFICATQIERLDNPNTKGATENSAGVFRCLNVEKLLQAVRSAKQESDFVVVFIHWGTESTDELDWAQKDQAPKIAEAGADLIIGAHPHVLQPIGYAGEVPVVYSLGNFLFNSRMMDSCLVRAVFDENGVKSLQFIPAKQENCSVSMQYGAEKERILSYMRNISPDVNIDSEGYIIKAQ